MPEGRAAATMRYIQKYGPYPVWNHTETRYYPVGEEMYAAMLEDMKSAQHYIFLEYFIIREGRMWSEILEVLKENAKLDNNKFLQIPLLKLDAVLGLILLQFLFRQDIYSCLFDLQVNSFHYQCELSTL